MTALSIGLSLATRSGPALAVSSPADLLLDLDFDSSRFRHGARQYSDLPSLLAAEGGIQGGAAIIFGPHVDPDALELLVNGDFSACDLSGWTIVARSGGGASVVAGAARLASTGSAVGINACRQDWPTLVINSSETALDSKSAPFQFVLLL